MTQSSTLVQDQAQLDMEAILLPPNVNFMIQRNQDRFDKDVLLTYRRRIPEGGSRIEVTVISKDDIKGMHVKQDDKDQSGFCLFNERLEAYRETLRIPVGDQRTAFEIMDGLLKHFSSRGLVEAPEAIVKIRDVWLPILLMVSISAAGICGSVWLIQN
jgi:hypothetical protein